MVLTSSKVLQPFRTLLPRHVAGGGFDEIPWPTLSFPKAFAAGELRCTVHAPGDTGRWVTGVGVWYFHIKKSALSQPLSIIHLKSIKESFIWTWFELCVETYSRRFYIWTNSKMMSCRLNLVLVDIRFENLFNQCFCPILVLWWVIQWPWTNSGFPMLSRKTILGSEKMDNVAWADCEAHYS